MAETYLHLPIEAGQIWEGRTRRRDGSRERVKVITVDGRAARVLSENPTKWKAASRSIGLLVPEMRGHAVIGNLRLVVLADGRRVVYPPGGGIRIEEAACGK